MDRYERRGVWAPGYRQGDEVRSAPFDDDPWRGWGNNVVREVARPNHLILSRRSHASLSLLMPGGMRRARWRRYGRPLAGGRP